MKKFASALLALLLTALLALPAMAIEVTPMEDTTDIENMNLFDVDMLNKWLDEGGRSKEGYIVGFEEGATSADENRAMMTWDIRKTWYLWEAVENGIHIPGFLMDDVADMTVTFYDGGERTGPAEMKANGETETGVWNQEGVYVTVKFDDGADDVVFMVNDDFNLETELGGVKLIFALEKREPQAGDPTSMEELMGLLLGGMSADQAEEAADDVEDAVEDAVESVVEDADDESLEEEVEEALDDTEIDEVIVPEGGVPADSMEAFDGTWKLTNVKVMGIEMAPDSLQMNWTMIISGGNVALIAVTGAEMENESMKGTLQDGGLLVTDDEGGAMLLMLNEAGQLVADLADEGSSFTMELVFEK